jgi:hypothetical protein
VSFPGKEDAGLVRCLDLTGDAASKVERGDFLDLVREAASKVERGGFFPWESLLASGALARSRWDATSKAERVGDCR